MEIKNDDNMIEFEWKRLPIILSSAFPVYTNRRNMNLNECLINFISYAHLLILHLLIIVLPITHYIHSHLTIFYVIT